MANKKKDKEHWDRIEFDVFNYRINVCYTSNINKSRQQINHKVGRPARSFSKYMEGLNSYHEDDAETFIFFTKKSSIGTIAHEVSHALWQMFRYFGVELDNEMWAYHLGYCIDKVMEFKNKVDAE